MTTTTNIQANGNTAINSANKNREEETMTHGNNKINLAARISRVLQTSHISKLLATAAVGLALTIGVAMPGSASADIPAVTNPGSYAFSNMNEDFTLVYGTFEDADSVNISTSPKLKSSLTFDIWNDDFTLVYGTHQDSDSVNISAPAKLKSSMTFDIWNDDFTLVYGTHQDSDSVNISAPAKLQAVTRYSEFGDDFTLVFGTYEDNINAPAKLKAVTNPNLWNEDFTLVSWTV